MGSQKFWNSLLIFLVMHSNYEFIINKPVLSCLRQQYFAS